jgi:hypothetical protein
MLAVLCHYNEECLFVPDIGHVLVKFQNQEGVESLLTCREYPWPNLDDAPIE